MEHYEGVDDHVELADREILINHKGEKITQTDISEEAKSDAENVTPWKHADPVSLLAPEEQRNVSKTIASDVYGDIDADRKTGDIGKFCDDARKVKKPKEAKEARKMFEWM